MELFDEFDYEDRSYEIHIGDLPDGVYFVLADAEGNELYKISANFLNLKDNIEASRTPLALNMVNLREEIKSLCVGFLTYQNSNRD